jgi:type I restriction enzyme R subunit
MKPTPSHLEREGRDYAPFDARGGLGRMHELFGERLDALIDELNRELTA